SQNYPNPFNPRTTIEFSLPKRSTVKITVLNLLGQTIETLLAEDLPAGVHRTTWDGVRFPSGIYLYRLQIYGSSTSIFMETKKMLLVR
ncbi:MAG: T9SS type A sorting domain-containing protein, partial [Candidatus Jorgensenbacteria bacterium]